MAQKFKVNTLVLSGSHVTATGANLYVNGAIISADTSTLATITNLFTTGSNLYNTINGFSGVFNSTGVAVQTQFANFNTNLASTGSTNDNKINTLSGYLNNQFINRLTDQNITGIKTFVSNYIFQSGSGINLYINNNPVLTGVIGGSNITVNNNNNGSFTINGSAGGGGGGAAVTGISITGSASFSGINGQINISGIGVTVILSGNNNILISGAAGGGLSTTTWSNLTWNPTTTWDATPNIYEDRKILVMTGNTTLSITSLYNGWAGALQTIQSGANLSGYSLNLPVNTKVANGASGSIYLTSGIGAVDIIGFASDGNNLFVNISNFYN